MTDLVVPQPGDPHARPGTPHGNRADTCGHCTLLPTVTGYVRATQTGCPVHGDTPWARRAAATGGGPCDRCGEPFFTHVCLSCSPDAQSPGPGCVNCRNTGMDQTPCKPPEATP